MRRVCAWCNLDMGNVPSETHQDNSITHGMCRECACNFSELLKIELMEFLDRLEAPVLTVDAAGRVTSANKQARQLLQKELPDIEDCKGGDVFECAFAKEPGGCGQTVHCDGCTIRIAVLETLQSGTSCLDLPANITRGTPGNRDEIRFLISTEKVNDLVLLRIRELHNEGSVCDCKVTVEPYAA